MAVSATARLNGTSVAAATASPHEHAEADHGQGLDADHPGHLPRGGPDQAKQRQLAGAFAGAHHQAVTATV
jgi:hypothetical protein